MPPSFGLIVFIFTREEHAEHFLEKARMPSCSGIVKDSMKNLFSHFMPCENLTLHINPHGEVFELEITPDVSSQIAKLTISGDLPSAESSDPESQFNLGLCYINGNGVTKNEREAAKWFRLAAEQGHIAAQYNLGVHYANGNGVAKDHVQAVKWYRLAADQGDAVAQHNLGLCYAKGNGVPVDQAEAFKWLRLAADQGGAHAQYDLGERYANGNGVSKDFVLANMWFSISAAKQNNKAEEARNALEDQMTPEQIAEARKMSREWMEKHKK